jgi:hypothetical protein
VKLASCDSTIPTDLVCAAAAVPPVVAEKDGMAIDEPDTTKTGQLVG